MRLQPPAEKSAAIPSTPYGKCISYNISWIGGRQSSSPNRVRYSTSPPRSTSSGGVYSLPLWLMPRWLGMNSIPTGIRWAMDPHRGRRRWASPARWLPAVRRLFKGFHQLGSHRALSLWISCCTVNRASGISSVAARISRISSSVYCRSTLRISKVQVTFPGTTLAALGLHWIFPAVNTRLCRSSDRPRRQRR